MRPEDGRVVTNFIAQAIRGDPITVYDRGTRTRSFCYVSDLVDGILRLVASEYAEPINLGNPHEMKIIDFAHLVRSLVGSSSEIVFVTPRDERTKDDPQTRQPDISLARAVLGWEPRVPLENGLKATIDYFRRMLEGKAG
jgi:dTDP-glucose 4,6-dehydratase